jgi:hypothetical protein
MKQPTFIEGVAVAFATSLAGSVLYSALGWMFPGSTVLRLLIAAIGLGYIGYLLSRSRERIGRVTVLAAWAVMAGAAWLIGPPLTLYVLLHLGAIWLTRSLYFYSSVLSALADLGLNGLSLAAAIWAITHSGSVFLGIWCFFLIQALFVAIPSSMRRKHGARGPGVDREDRFQHAHRVAQAAVRKLSSTH